MTGIRRYLVNHISARWDASDKYIVTQKLINKVPSLRGFNEDSNILILIVTRARTCRLHALARHFCMR